jgi:hypothetical protein
MSHKLEAKYSRWASSEISANRLSGDIKLRNGI